MVLVKFLQLLADQRLRNGNKIASKTYWVTWDELLVSPICFFSQIPEVGLMLNMTSTLSCNHSLLADN
jgi:hypothetical protein